MRARPLRTLAQWPRTTAPGPASLEHKREFLAGAALDTVVLQKLAVVFARAEHALRILGSPGAARLRAFGALAHRARRGIRFHGPFRVVLGGVHPDCVSCVRAAD